MSDFREGFQEHWAAHFARRMEERVAAALRAMGPEERCHALEEALDAGKEARLRLESGSTHNEETRQALRHLEAALDGVLAALNVFDPGYDPPIREALEHAGHAAVHLSHAAK